MMKTKLLAITMLLGASSLFAHNPQLSTYNLKKIDQAWALDISLSQEGIHETLLRNHKKERVIELTPDEYKALIIEYVRSNIKFVLNGKEPLIREGSLRLGNHQTDLRFLLDSMPDKINTIVATLTAGSEDREQTNILAIHDENTFCKLFLSEENEYMVQGEINLTGFVPLSPAHSASVMDHVHVPWILAILIVAGGIVFLVFRKSTQPKFVSSVWF